MNEFNHLNVQYVGVGVFVTQVEFYCTVSYFHAKQVEN